MEKNILYSVRASGVPMVAIYNPNEMWLKIASPDCLGVYTAIETLNFPCLVDESLATAVLSFWWSVKGKNYSSDIPENEMAVR